MALMRGLLSPKQWTIASSFLIGIIAVAFYFSVHVSPPVKQFPQPASTDVLESVGLAGDTDPLMVSEGSYGRLLNDLVLQDYSDYTGGDLVYGAETASGKAEKLDGIGGSGKKSVVTHGEDGYIEWKVSVNETALYQIDLTYYAMPGNRMDVQRSLMIDGKPPFAEAARLQFPRTWKDGDGARNDNQGNEMRMPQEEVQLWRTAPLKHPEDFYRRPYKFLLTAGEHTIRLDDVREPMAVTELILKKPARPPAYEELLETYPKANLTEMQTGLIKVQAEHPVYKSNPFIRSEWSEDALSEPSGADRIRYNIFGATRWNRGGQSATWTFDVPEDGLYKIGFRYLTLSDITSRRSIEIDGEIPFQELEEYAFPASGEWHVDALKGESGEPYLFYLKKGEHSISLTVKLGANRQTIQRLNEVLQELSLLSREVMQVTASSKDATGQIQSDRNRDWDLEKTIPNLVSRIEKLRDILQESERNVIEVNGGKRPSFVSPLSSGAHLLNRWANNTELIPQQLNELGNLQTSLAQATLSMRDQPLSLDYIVIGAPDASYPRGTSTYSENLQVAAKKFIRSFTEDSSKVGDVHMETAAESGSSGSSEPVLNVWVARGREWVEIMKEMIDDDFTPSTGIRVNMNTVPLNSEHLLLLAYTAGQAPDVALGINARTPVEFAVRNAVYDLNRFRDAKEIAGRFVPEALVPLQYKSGLYALPETQDFNMLFYRTDIFKTLGLNPPQTWDDLYALMPTLLENEMTFYYPDGVGGFYPFLFQHGGELYSDDLQKSALDSPEALQAFKEWTDLYNNYKLQMKADFFQRIRTGEMPIGIGGYDMYVRLATTAPELNGRWAMTPMPGIARKDGTIDRSAGGSNQTGIILNSTHDPEASWELLKWWTSKETQERFALEVEGQLGVGSRWNTANVEAMKSLSWTKEEIAAIMEQWSSFKETPVVLGGYYTDRHLLNAWNRTVLLGESPRIALEDAVKEINKELLRKQEEFDDGASASKEGGNR